MLSHASPLWSIPIHGGVTPGTLPSSQARTCGHRIHGRELSVVRCQFPTVSGEGHENPPSLNTLACSQTSSSTEENLIGRSVLAV